MFFGTWWGMFVVLMFFSFLWEVCFEAAGCVILMVLLLLFIAFFKLFVVCCMPVESL